MQAVNDPNEAAQRHSRRIGRSTRRHAASAVDTLSKPGTGEASPGRRSSELDSEQEGASGPLNPGRGNHDGGEVSASPPQKAGGLEVDPGLPVEEAGSARKGRSRRWSRSLADVRRTHALSTAAR